MPSALSELFGFVARLTGRRGVIQPAPGYLDEKSVVAHLENVPVRSKGLLCAPREGDCDYHDGGDSAQKTGIAAFCNSKIDQDALPRFMPNGATLVCRNPDQEEWRHPYGIGDKGTSRDQLVQYAAGCWRARGDKPQLVARMLAGNLSWGSMGFVNKDVLLPHNTMFLRACASVALPAADAIGQLFLRLAIEAQKEGEEINGLIVHSIVCGQLDYFLKKFPQYETQVHDYWGTPGVRWSGKSQYEIGEALITAVETERSRYPEPITENEEWQRLLRLAMGPMAPLLFMIRLADELIADPKAFVLKLVDGDLDTFRKELETFLGDVVNDAVATAADAAAIATGITEGIRNYLPDITSSGKPAAPPVNNPRIAPVLLGAAFAAAEELGIDLTPRLPL